MNRNRFDSILEFRGLIDKQKGESVALLVRRGQGTIYVPVEVG
ncbi:MAG TPA: hypothetical protein VFZ81_14495 [Burkholderiales bacterium]